MDQRTSAFPSTRFRPTWLSIFSAFSVSPLTAAISCFAAVAGSCVLWATWTASVARPMAVGRLSLTSQAFSCAPARPAQATARPTARNAGRRKADIRKSPDCVRSGRSTEPDTPRLTDAFRRGRGQPEYIAGRPACRHRNPIHIIVFGLVPAPAVRKPYDLHGYPVAKHLYRAVFSWQGAPPNHRMAHTDCARYLQQRRREISGEPRRCKHLDSWAGPSLLHDHVLQHDVERAAAPESLRSAGEVLGRHVVDLAGEQMDLLVRSTVARG